MSPVFRRAHGPRRPRRITRRALGVATGSVLVGAMVLGTATSSAHGGPTTLVADDMQAPMIVAAIVASTPSAPLGFAPPPPRAETLVAPQFRLAADLPSGPLGIPGIVLQAYKLAANRIDAESPQCKLPWFLLAGIGRIESNHAGNGSVDQYGTTINPIDGPVLDGSLSGNEVIHDTDGGAVDGDSAHDRAIGPMQFIPSTWAHWGSDANGDGKADPNNVFDATYSAARYLCAGVTDIMAGDHKVAAVLRYNHSMDYVANVLAWAAAYATGVMPTTPIREPRRPPSSSRKPSKSPSSSSRSSSQSSSSPASPSPASPSPASPCLVVCLPTLTLPPLPGQPAPRQNAPHTGNGRRATPPPATRSTPVPRR